MFKPFEQLLFTDYDNIVIMSQDEHGRWQDLFVIRKDLDLLRHFLSQVRAEGNVCLVRVENWNDRNADIYLTSEDFFNRE